MKKIIITLLFIFIGTYAQADSYEKSSKRGYLYIGVGSEFLPMNDFRYVGTPFDIKYGGYVSSQSFVEIGFSTRKSTTAGEFDVMFGPNIKYGYDFIKDTQWVPGLDVSVLIGPRWQTKASSEEGELFLTIGFELGLYVRTFISRSHAIMLRSGISKGEEAFSDFDSKHLKTYLHVVVQWFF